MSSSESRGRWINNDRAFLRNLAQQISEDSSIVCIPTRDKNTLRIVSSSPAAWDNFESTVARQEDERSAERDPKRKFEQGSLDEIDDLSLLFRSRCLLFENSIAANLFPNDDLEEYSLLSPYVVHRNATTLQRETEAVANNKHHGRDQAEDDDYDDDDDENEVEAAVVESRPHPVFGHGENQYTAASHAKALCAPPIVARPRNPDLEALEDRRNEQKILAFELNSMYHTLEYDRHALLEQNTLEASDRQVEEESEPVEKEKLSSVNFGAANLSLKHLISKIDQSREKLAMSDNELRVLLSEVRKNRSKWANEDKVGQEELYEAAERVVIELRGYTEHSTAFLNKVTKRDVPDYYNIIKEPMDLGTLMKNLKNLQYKSKAEFSKDLMLIWDNCLRYNADAAHPLRKHAYAMQRKSEQLLAMVPDVVIRDRADVEAEELGLTGGDADEDDDDDTPLAGKSTRGTFGPKSVKAKKSKSAPKQVKLEGEPDRLNGFKAEDLDVEMPISPERTLQAQKTTADASNGAKLELIGGGNNAASDSDDTDETNAAFQIWRTKTKKGRAQYAGARHKRLKQDALKSEELALTPTPHSLARTILPSSTDYSNLSAPTNSFDSATSSRPSSTGNGFSDVSHIFLREYEPTVVPSCITGSQTEPPSDKSFLIQDPSRFDSPAGGLIEKMRATTLQMKNIRRLCTKLSTLKLMQDPTMSAFPASYFRQLMESEGPLKFEPLEIEQSGFAVEPCGEDLARALLQRSASHILYQSGFEDFQPQAVDCFTEVASDFMKMLGKTMKEFTESRQCLTEEAVLRHTLFEVGIPDLNALEDYAIEEVENKSEKIVALHDRLKKFLNDFIQGTVDGDSADQDLFDEKNQDAFVAGSFGDETGEDFFGFRELGLEKEFGMSSLSVPLRLLQGRLRPVNGANVAVDGETGSALRFDRRFPHITKDVARRQIGIFRPFLDAKLALIDADEEQQYLVEDEDLPMRQRKPKPRLGPTGKITSAMKRPIKDPHMSPKKRKKVERESEGLSPTATFS